MGRIKYSLLIHLAKNIEITDASMCIRRLKRQNHFQNLTTEVDAFAAVCNPWIDPNQVSWEVTRIYNGSVIQSR